MPSPETFNSILNKNRETVLRDYAAGQTLNQLAARIGCSSTVVRDFLHAAGCEVRRRGTPRGTKRKTA